MNGIESSTSEQIYRGKRSTIRIRDFFWRIIFFLGIVEGAAVDLRPIDRCGEKLSIRTCIDIGDENSTIYDHPPGFTPTENNNEIGFFTPVRSSNAKLFYTILTKESVQTSVGSTTTSSSDVKLVIPISPPTSELERLTVVDSERNTPTSEPISRSEDHPTPILMLTEETPTTPIVERSDAEASEALARQLMAEEALEVYRISQSALLDNTGGYTAEDLAILRTLMSEENPYLANSLSPSRSEQEALGALGDEDLSYDRLLEIGEVLGDVREERWVQRAEQVLFKPFLFLKRSQEKNYRILHYFSFM